MPIQAQTDIHLRYEKRNIMCELMLSAVDFLAKASRISRYSKLLYRSTIVCLELCVTYAHESILIFWDSGVPL